MKRLSIDVETYSETDLTKTGVYRYAEDPSFEILLFGVAVDERPVTVYDLIKLYVIPAEELPDVMFRAERRGIDPDLKSLFLKFVNELRRSLAQTLDKDPVQGKRKRGLGFKMFRVDEQHVVQIERNTHYSTS